MASRSIYIGSVDAFADGKPRRVEVDGRGLVVVRRGDILFALRDICPHQGALLSDGQVAGAVLPCRPGAEIELARDGEILVCPWHGWQFDLRTGRSLVDPDKIRVRVYTVRVEGGRALVELD